MYSSIQIDGYRGLDSFSLTGLGRINLLVGANNSGKTSILECIELLQSEGSPQALYSILRRRGELALSPTDDHLVPVVRHLFPRHQYGGQDLAISGRERAAVSNEEGGLHKVTMRVCEEEVGTSPDEIYFSLSGEELEERRTSLVLNVESSSAPNPIGIPMTMDGLLPKSFRARRSLPTRPVASFLRAEGMEESDVSRHLQDIAFTDREEHVVDALRLVEPEIKRIAVLPYDGQQPNMQPRTGVFLKLENVYDRVPIGSLGDGLWRMLGLALALANSRGGVLLIDEIDTGLHYSVMADMWRMVSERAAALSIQVFATTHSRDCYESLSVVATPERIGAGDVTIQRIERRRDKAIRFSNGMIVVAAERGLEVR